MFPLTINNVRMIRGKFFTSVKPFCEYNFPSETVLSLKVMISSDTQVLSTWVNNLVNPPGTLTEYDQKVGPVGLEPTTYGLKVRSSNQLS